MKIKKRPNTVVMAVAFISLLAVAAFYWEEARKELVFLCGNFQKGVGKRMVLRQLDTGHFLRYRVEEDSGGSRAEADSVLNLGVYKCMIEFDSQENVVKAFIR